MNRRELVPIFEDTQIPFDLERYVDGDERLRELARDPISNSTDRTYNAAWESFVGWCFENEFSPLPAHPITVGRYIRWLVDRPSEEIEERYTRNGHDVVRRRRRKGADVKTVRLHLAAIRRRHLAEGHPSPAQHPAIRNVIKNVARERGSAAHPKKALEKSALEQAIASLVGERLILVRDRALLLLGWTGAFRRSEIVGIDVVDVTEEAEGLDVRLRFSKTNQQGEFEHVLIPRAEDPQLCAVTAVAAWRRAAGLADVDVGPLFRHVDRHGKVRGPITPQVISIVVKRATAAAGLDAALFAGHSLRSGWITTAQRAGRSEASGMRHTRHRSEKVYRGYIQRVAKWEDHPGLGLL